MSEDLAQRCVRAVALLRKERVAVTMTHDAMRRRQVRGENVEFFPGANAGMLADDIQTMADAAISAARGEHIGRRARGILRRLQID